MLAVGCPHAAGGQFIETRAETVQIFGAIVWRVGIGDIGCDNPLPFSAMRQQGAGYAECFNAIKQFIFSLVDNSVLTARGL